MSKGYPLVQIAATGDVQGGRQRSPHIIKGSLVPYLRVANVFDGYIDFSDVKEMTFSPEEIERFRLLPGDILLNEGQSVQLVGRAAMYVQGPEDCCFQNTLIRYRAGPNTDPRFAVQLFRYCQSIGIFSKIAVKTNSIAHLGVSRFAELELPFPPYQQQVELAKLLDDWDAAIAKTERLIALRVQQKAWLISRVVSISGRKTKLGSFLHHVSRPVPKPAQAYWALGIRSHGKGTFQRFVDDPSSVDMEELYEVVRDDLILNITFAWEGAIASVKPEDERCLVSHRFPTYEVDNEIADPAFLSYILNRNAFFSQLALISPGGAGRNRVLNKRDFLKLEVCLPPPEEQKRLARIMGAMDTIIEKERSLLVAFKSQKRGLMQKLLTGQFRVPANQEVVV